MKILALMIVIIPFLFGWAVAQPGSIGIFPDPMGTSCSLYDTQIGLLLVYVVHLYAPGATGARFQIVQSSGVNLMYLSEVATAPYTKTGSAFKGVEISYGSCVATPNMILTMQFFADGRSETCSAFLVKPHPESGIIGVWNCESPPNLLEATGGCVWVNADWIHCGCNVGVWLTCDDLSPAENTSWGQIKALYRD
jgi:hypothetical protein